MIAKTQEPSSTPSKILMTADAVGGVWQYSVDLIRELSAFNMEVVLATLGPRPTVEQRQQVHAIAGATLIESDFALEWMPNPWYDVDASGDWLLQLQSELKPDVVHLNGYSHAALAWRLPVVIAAHSCVFSWWRSVHHSPPDDSWAEYKRRVTHGLAAASAVIAPSRFMARAVASEYALDADDHPGDS